MKIFSATQLRTWDQYTIINEPVSSIDLMERASRACANRILEITDPQAGFIIFSGPGNNGGDGFAIAKILSEYDRDVRIFHFNSPTLSKDCKTNRERWENLGFPVADISGEGQFPGTFEMGKVIIDAIFGTGQTRPLEGIYASACQAINSAGLPVIAIDIPSGIFCDESSAHLPHIRANHTLSLQAAKLCFFFPENHDAFGHVEIIDIGLSREYYDSTEAIFSSIDIKEVKAIVKPRDEYAHKGNFGKALLLAGSMGMMGAAILAAKACLRSGVGKLFSATPSDGLTIFQQALPEAICITDKDPGILTSLPPDPGQYQAIGAGPGIGNAPGTRTMIRQVLAAGTKALVLDADALNIVAEDQLLDAVPENTVITPHIAEFTRLFGTSINDFERARLAISKAREYKIFIILKGRHTLVATPDGKGFFNLTGNPGMAKGGSGDVLTGIITGLAAQSYPPEDACKIAVFLHGMAGDLARDRYSEHAMLASDIIEEIGPAFKKLV
jgi:NAD(P)H-hydrate epimerase